MLLYSIFVTHGGGCVLSLCVSIFHVPSFQNYGTPSMSTITFIWLNEMFTQQTGMTALHYAAMQQKAEVVNALLKAGSKVDEKDKVCMFEVSYTQCRSHNLCGQ